MRLGKTLTTKAIAVVALPCLMQVALVMSYGSILHRLEDVFAYQSDSRAVTGHLNWIGFVLASGLLILNEPKSSAGNDNKLKDYQSAALKSVGELATILQGDESQQKRLEEMKAVSEKLLSAEPDTEKRNTLLNTNFANIRHEIIAAQKSKFRVSQADLPQLRGAASWLINALAIFSVGTGVFLIVFFQRNVVKRLKVIDDNSVRFARGESLMAPDRGEDEIANLDRGFHDMAKAVDEAARKERAIIKNATAVICSLSAGGEFLQVNPACLSVFGYSEERLKAMLIRDIVTDEFKETVNQIVIDACAAPAAVEFENQIVKPNGKIVDILWSAQWSQSEKALFCVAQDITEKKKVEQLKQEIVQMVSHDLRSPIMAITASIYLLKMGTVPEGMEKHLNNAQVSIDRMKTLVDDLLDIEKIKSGMLEIEQKNVDLSEVFEEVVLSLSPWAKTVGVELEAADDQPIAFIDHDRIVQVLVNLVANALKFSPSGGKILLEAEQGEREISVTVSDEGPGIPADLQPVLFERFTQAKSGSGGAKGGSGLGLAICKSLVELHGGRIWAQSRQPKGTTIVLTLPKEKTTKAGDEPRNN